MPRAYAETYPNGLPIDRNVQAAIDGFLALGYEITTFTRQDIEQDKFWRVAAQNPFVGSIKTITKHFENLEKVPQRIDYPQPLNSHLHRTVEQMPLEEALRLEEPVFIKPVETKLFDGALYDGSEIRRAYFADYGHCNVWVSELIKGIESEWRCYVHQGRFLHASCYAGDFQRSPNWAVIETMIAAWENAPVSYTLDVAVTKNGTIPLIEANDFWAIGSYSLGSIEYAEMLRDRYFEIVGG
ncbi:DUF4343 domain-containing protein [bacterium]|nr:MAG: DUF4343 domain-containing protein [bacterium]